jgi:uncharacterized RDD family membrane protein YckC
VDTLRIETAQHVAITYEVAGIGDRAIASIVDAFIQISVLVLAWLLLAMAAPQQGFWVYMGAWIIVTVYHPFCEAVFDGRSVGKAVVGTRVARIDGGRPGAGAFAIRWLLGLVEIWMTIGVVALLAVLISRKGQRIGDMAAGTAVLRVRKAADVAETGLLDVSDDAQAHYPEVALLTSGDIQVIRKVLHQTRANGRNARTDRLLRRTKEVVEQKMGLPTVDEQPYRFLLRVMADYNAVRS